MNLICILTFTHAAFLTAVFFVFSITVLLLITAIAIRLKQDYRELQTLKQTLETKFSDNSLLALIKSNLKELPRVETGFEYNCYNFNITDREKAIIKCISEGCSYKSTANQLCISVKTVTKHMQNIYVKTGTKNKVEMLKRINKN